MRRIRDASWNPTRKHLELAPSEVSEARFSQQTSARVGCGDKKNLGNRRMHGRILVRYLLSHVV
jgi:hypothetical protein